MLSSPSVFEMSIEAVSGERAVRDGYHLGTIESLARTLIVERFNGRTAAGMQTVTIGLIYAGRLVDIFDGKWQSERDAEAFEGWE